MRIAWHLVTVAGGRAIPGRAVTWDPPMGEELWQSLESEWQHFMGPFNGLAVFERTQMSRGGFAALLLTNGTPIAFVKARKNDRGTLTHEYAALEAMGSASSVSFAFPRAVAMGSADQWHYLLTTAIDTGLHRVPSRPPLKHILEEIRSGLESLPRPEQTPDYWEPIHGDFTPWNLRQGARKGLFLVDWEEAGWGPPGADEVYYLAVSRALGAKSEIPDNAEARRFWIESLKAREANGETGKPRDHELSRQLLRALRER
jgi:hypothetical protein